MTSYLVRRILLFVPTLFIISLVAFGISVSAPGDPVEIMFNSAEGGKAITAANRQQLVSKKRRELGLDQPLFYFSINTLAEGSTAAPVWKNYVPAVHFYGTQNQYHHWLGRLMLHGDFGTSYATQLPVMEEIKPRLAWSFSLTLISVILAFGISIPIGMYAARYRDRWFDKISGFGLFLLYSIPNFFMATLLLVFFANPQFFKWFPESGVQDALNFDNTWPFWIKIQHWAPYLVLPLIAYTYSSIAFISRQMRTGAIEVLDQEFIKTARAKGLSEGAILWKHVFRNALMPIITIFAQVFPAAITGSLIVETIFAIPGMGREIYLAIMGHDYPIIVAVFTVFGLFTLVGYLVSDILYAIADPRISYSKS